METTESVLGNGRSNKNARPLDCALKGLFRVSQPSLRIVRNFLKSVLSDAFRTSPGRAPADRAPRTRPAISYEWRIGISIERTTRKDSNLLLLSRKEKGRKRAARFVYASPPLSKRRRKRKCLSHTRVAHIFGALFSLSSLEETTARIADSACPV